jgi:rRNA biogenesis protein RRP5
VSGYVVNTNVKAGCFLELGNLVTGRVQLKHLANKFVREPTAVFPVGRPVVGRLLGIEPYEPLSAAKKSKKHSKKSARPALQLTPYRASVTLRDADVTGHRSINFSSIKPGMAIAGNVKRIQKYGVFISLHNNTRLTGLCHISEASDDQIGSEQELQKRFKVGDPVMTVVLRKNDAKKQLSLSLKQSRVQTVEADMVFHAPPSEAERRARTDKQKQSVFSDEESDSEEGARQLSAGDLDALLDDSDAESMDEQDDEAESEDEQEQQDQEESEDQEESKDQERSASSSGAISLGTAWLNGGKDDSSAEEDEDSAEEEEDAKPRKKVRTLSTEEERALEEDQLRAKEAELAREAVGQGQVQ